MGYFLIHIFINYNKNLQKYEFGALHVGRSAVTFRKLVEDLTSNNWRLFFVLPKCKLKHIVPVAGMVTSFSGCVNI